MLLILILSAYAETLGYAMELEQGLTTVRLVPGGGGGGGGATSTDAAYLAGAQRFLADPDQVPYLLYVRQILEVGMACGCAGDRGVPGWLFEDMGSDFRALSIAHPNTRARARTHLRHATLRHALLFSLCRRRRLRASTT